LFFFFTLRKLQAAEKAAERNQSDLNKNKRLCSPNYFCSKISYYITSCI